MQYQRRLITGFKTGYYLGAKPWLCPQDAFPVMRNARLNKFVLEKRAGYTLLASTGAGHPIAGIFEARYKGVPRILVMDTRRAYCFSSLTNTLSDLSGSDVFTGGDSDFFRFWNYFDKTCLCNGVDSIYAWDDSVDTLTAVSTAGAVSIQTCRGLFIFKDRLHIVSPTIGGVYYPDRIYYTDVGLLTIASTTQYYRYARADVPLAYHAIDMNNVLLMGKVGAWKAEYTGDSDNPFRCVTADESRPCLTPNAIFEFRHPKAGKLIATMSKGHIVGFDGFQFQNIDWPITGVQDDMDVRYLYLSHGCKLTEREAFYMTYPSTDAGACDSILEYNIDDDSWSTHRLRMHCIAALSGEVDPATIGLPAEQAGRLALGYTYGGDQAGSLYRLDYGDDDNGSDVEFWVQSAALNPYHSQGRQAYLGWLEFYLDNDPDAEFVVNLYKDEYDAPYKTLVVSCDGTGEKFWLRANIGGEVGNFHTIELYNKGSGNRPKIHAIAVWMAMGGKMSQGSGTAGTWPAETWRLHSASGVLYVQHKEGGSWVDMEQWGA